MRTFVQLKLRQVEPPTPEEAVRKWLEAARLSPQAITIPQPTREALSGSDEVSPDIRVPSDSANKHALDIFLAIPRFELERDFALETSKYIIHLDDTANNTIVWGLVCVDGTTVTIRWRHRSTKSLEYATELLIKNVWEHAGPEKLFHAFEPGHRIPVREPRSTNDEYAGVVLGTRNARIAHARTEKKSERRIAFGALAVFVICTYGGYQLLGVVGGICHALV
jgi:hypothetical protein